MAAASTQFADRRAREPSSLGAVPPLPMRVRPLLFSAAFSDAHGPQWRVAALRSVLAQVFAASISTRTRECGKCDCGRCSHVASHARAQQSPRQSV